MSKGAGKPSWSFLIAEKIFKVIISFGRRRLCYSAEEHWGSACGNGTHVLRRDGPRVGVLTQLWHCAPWSQTWQVRLTELSTNCFKDDVNSRSVLLNDFFWQKLTRLSWVLLWSKYYSTTVPFSTIYFQLCSQLLIFGDGVNHLNVTSATSSEECSSLKSSITALFYPLLRLHKDVKLGREQDGGAR